MSSTPATEASASSRGVSWSDDEVRALLTIWGEGKVQEELDGAVRNKVVYVGIAKKMRELGYERDWQQCKVKIKNLKSTYRDIKDHNGETGRGRKTCKFYKELDEILGHRPASTPPVVLDSGATTNTSTSLDSAEEEETNGNHSSITKQRYLTYLIFTDGDDVQADAPEDSADIPGSSLESTSKKPVEEAGVYMCISCKQ